MIKTILYSCVVICLSYTLLFSRDSLFVFGGQGSSGSRDNPVEIVLKNHIPVSGIQFNLQDKPNVLTCSSALNGKCAADFSLSVLDRDTCVSVLLYDTEGKMIGAGNDTILTLFFDVDSIQLSGTVSLQFSDVTVADSMAQAIPVAVVDGSFKIMTTTVQEGGKNKPTSFHLQQNYPNPFNAQTRISYILNQKTRVKIDIVNVSGGRVTTLINARQSAGEHSVCWNSRDNHGNDLPSGLYFYRLRAGKNIAVKRCLLLK
ncbi:T9SS type A sorting domain-containing protein [candidate division KSB1 bacterium]|nr:T9SS type A sorting domain-containing protein [candidate division KSB1 bacterium]